jgi:hypothetical protein
VHEHADTTATQRRFDELRALFINCTGGALPLVRPTGVDAV